MNIFPGEFGNEAKQFQPQFGQWFNEEEINPRALEAMETGEQGKLVFSKT